MIIPEPQEFGGLEEIATMLAIDLHNSGHQISVITSVWASYENQYLRRLQENDVEVVQPPRNLSLAASSWETKQRLVAAAMWLLSPAVWVLALGLRVGRGKQWEIARKSALGWVQGQIASRFINPDRRDLVNKIVLSWWCRKWQPDILHVHGYAHPASTLLPAVEWASSHQLPVVYELHQTPDTNFYEWESFRTHINKADRIVAVSEKSANSLRQLVGAERPIEIIGPIVANPDIITEVDSASEGEHERATRITTIARLSPAKGLEYLLDSIAEVLPTYPKASFKVYGDGPLRQELLEHATNLGLKGEEILVGSFTTRDQLRSILLQTDIFVMSSLLEGQPLAIVEAMAYGRPIVATAVGGIPELIDDGVNGFLCEPRDSSCLAESIVTLLGDPSLRARMGAAARESYQQGPFQPAIAARRFSLLYEQVLQEREDIHLGRIRPYAN